MIIHRLIDLDHCLDWEGDEIACQEDEPEILVQLVFGQVIFWDCINLKHSIR